MSDNTIYSWDFDDNKNRWHLWHIIALSIVIWLVIWWFLTKQYWMSFLVLLIAWVWYFVENNSLDSINVKVTDLWINVSNIFYDFSRINSYFFIYQNDQAIYLRLMLNKKWVWYINLRVDNSIVSELNKILPNFLEESPKKDLSFSDKLIDILKL